MQNLDAIAIFSMLVSLTAMVIQLVFGVLAQKRAATETNRQIAETKKQEKLLAMQTEESYKHDVRNWGRAVVDQLAMAQQLCLIDPKDMITNDYLVKRAETVAALRGLLNRGKWLFPNLAIPSYEDQVLHADTERELSALETLLYSYHTLDQLKAESEEKRKTASTKIRKLRNEFVREMRRAVDPHVRGADIETLVKTTEEELAAEALGAKQKTQKSDMTN